MIIDAGMLRLRPLTLVDADEWLAGEDDDMARGFEFPRRSTRDDAVRAIGEWSESWRLGGPVRQWAICDVATRAIAGGVELRQLEGHDVNLSYHVFAAWRRRGFATRAAELAIAYAAGVMRASRVVIKALDDNLASIAVARNLRARWVGTMPSDAGGTLHVFHRDVVPGDAAALEAIASTDDQTNPK